jgi:ABC-type nickel/cobalt efflux system permease component RcnA
MASKPGLKSVALGLACLGLLLSPLRGATHPLGNFSISHYTRIHITPDAIELHYLLDMAEIPTFQELQDMGLVADVHHPNMQAYLVQRAETLKTGLVLEINGQHLALENVARELSFPPGAGGLPTLKLGLVYRTPLRLAARDELSRLYYRDTNFPGRAGWQEIIAVADAGMTLVHSSVPTLDRSQALTTYPTDLLHSPPQVLQAQIFFTPLQSPPFLAAVTPSAPDPAAALQSNASQPGVQPSMTVFTRQVNTPNTPRNAFTELITTQQLSLGVVCLALSVAVGLGAFHALEPGHGKTVVAAYLVGSRGTAWHAFALGCIVTVTHTAGVYLLGLVTLYASRYVLPERLYPWLGACSGLLIAGLGGWLLFRRYAERGHRPPHLHTHTHAHPHPHIHSHGHGHHHHYHQESGHGHQHHPEEPSERVSYRELLALGVTGGIVPCPAALVVLLSAIALQRVGFGLLLIAAFSAGLATVLIAIGLLMVYARHFMARFQGEGPLIRRWLPLTSAATITVFGLAMVVQALVAAGVLHLRL